MTDFLLFTLFSPLVSWGDIAVGETRASWDRPSRSAVLGTLAAALGIERDDTEAHRALDVAHGIAVKTDATGDSLVDYHTAQTLAASTLKKRRPSSRHELLALLNTQDAETILSRRRYRTDALATVAVWMRGHSRWSLEELATALRTPVFLLYAGRKANALGLPVDPQLVEASTLAAALNMRSFERARAAGFAVTRLAITRAPEVAHDPCDGFSSGLRPVRREVRRDVPTDRARWQFADRVVEVGVLEPPGASGPA